MQRKLSSFVTLLFVAGLLLLQVTSQAMTGWVYSYGSVIQNGVCGQSYVNVYDYGMSKASGFYFNVGSGSFRSVTVDTIKYNCVSGACVDVMLTGQGSYSTAAGVTAKGMYTLHIWKGIVNGVLATWGQAELWSAGSKPGLLWATGSTWPAAASTPIKMAGSILRPYTP